MRWSAARVLLSVVFVAFVRLAAAWQVAPFDGRAFHVAFDAERNVIAAGWNSHSGEFGRLVVMKLSPRGHILWDATLPDDLTTPPRSLALDRAGNVYVAGAVGGQDADDFGAFAVIKIDALSGVEVWWWTTSPLDGLALHVVVDGFGDVFSAGYYQTLDLAGEVFVGVGLCIKLSGATGAELWRVERPDGKIRSVAMRGDADVITVEDDAVRLRSGATGVPVWQTVGPLPGGRVEVDGAGDAIVSAADRITKVAGESGAVRWQTVVVGFDDGLHPLRAVTTDGFGDVVAAGTVDAGRDGDFGDFAVVKLAAGDNRERWRQVVVGEGWGAARSVAVDPAGDVVVSGDLGSHPQPPHFNLVKLAGLSGDVVWQRTARGKLRNAGVGDAVAVDGNGSLAATGTLNRRVRLPGRDDFRPSFAVVRLTPGGRGLVPLPVRWNPLVPTHDHFVW